MIAARPERKLERQVVALGNGERASYLATGTGPPVVLVHGLGLSATVWRPHLAELRARGYAATAPDLPGFGSSGRAPTGRSVPYQTDWLLALADALGLGAPAWIGHSLSAQVLVRLAAAHPTRVSALVLAAPTGRPGGTLPRQFAGLLATAPHESFPLILHVARQYLSRPLTTLGTWIRARSHEILDDAPGVGTPTLVVRGQKDPVVPAAFVERLEAALPRGRLVRIEGAAHAVALDPLDPFMEAVASFLDEVYRPLTSPS